MNFRDSYRIAALERFLRNTGRFGKFGLNDRAPSGNVLDITDSDCSILSTGAETLHSTFFLFFSFLNGTGCSGLEYSLSLGLEVLFSL